MNMRLDDILITIAYFSIPIQLVVSLYQFPALIQMPMKLVILLILFALFVFCCGVGHMLRCMNMSHNAIYITVNTVTAIVSMATALYLVPLVPNMMSLIQQSIKDMERLHEASEAKTIKLLTFMAFLCHEIRNPLFAITSTAAFLGDEPLTENQESALCSINQSADLMLRIVNDVLDVSKLESGKLVMEIRDFDLRMLMHGAAASMKTHIEKSSIDNENAKGTSTPVDFQFEMDDSVPKIVKSDSVRLLQIVYNLLTNAAKFTEEGSIKFLVTTESYTEAKRKGFITIEAGNNEESFASEQSSGDRHDQEENDFGTSLLASMEEGCTRTAPDEATEKRVILKIQVIDTGCGIPAERVRTIFEPFSQSKISDYRKHGGTGLGLSIISRLSESMGGSVHCSSVEDQGSTFTCYLPVALSSELFLSETSKTEGSKDFTTQMMQMVNPTPPNLKHSIPPDDSAPARNLQKDLSPAAFLSKGSADPMVGSESQDSHTGGFTSSTNVTMCSVTPLPAFPAPSLPPTLDVLPQSPAKRDPSERKQRTRKEFKKFDIKKGDGVVLVVDDNAVNRKLIGRMLQCFNIEYDVAENGQEAIDQVMKSRNVTGNQEDLFYSMILMDLSMPVLGGIEATRILREDHHVTIPIIALTANALVENKEEALEAGVTIFCTKPILRDTLYEVCVEYIRHP